MKQPQHFFFMCPALCSVVLSHGKSQREHNTYMIILLSTTWKKVQGYDMANEWKILFILYVQIFPVYLFLKRMVLYLCNWVMYWIFGKKNSSEHQELFLFCEGDWILAQVAQGGCGLPPWRYSKLSRHGPGHQSLGVPAWAEGLDQRTCRDPFQP